MTLGLVLLLAATAQAAPMWPGDAERDSIMHAIRTGTYWDLEAQKYRAEYAKLTDPEQKWDKLLKAKEAEHERTTAFNSAIQMTLHSFQIGPDGMRQGDWKTSKQGPKTGAKIGWDPRFLPEGGPWNIKYIGADGLYHYQGRNISPDISGVTWSDGSVTITRAMLKRVLELGHPGPLAYILHHEARHFNDIVTRKDDSLQATEQRAYTASADAADLFKLPPDWKTFFEQQRDANAAAVGTAAARPSHPTPAEEEVFKAGFEAQEKALADIRRGEAALQAQVEAARAARAQEANRARSAASDAGWAALRTWAGTACSYLKNYPDVIRLSPDVHADAKTWRWVEEENARRIAQSKESGAAMRAYLLTHFVALPRDEIDARLSAPGSRIDSCQRGIIEAIRDARAPLDAASLVEKLDYKRGGGALGVVVQGIAEAVRSGATSFVEGITAPFVYSESDGGARQEDPVQGQGRDRSANEDRRSNRIPDIDNTRAMRDLRGVGSTNWRGF